VSNLFIVSLAVADVIVGIIVMPMSAFYIFTERWMLGVAVCQIWIGVDYTASTASILNLFILSLDRYWSVRQPLKYLHKRTKRRAMTMIGIVWAVSSLWIIPISSWHYFAHGGVRTVENEKCDTEYAKNSAFKLVTAFFNFYLPVSVMYILYFRIFIAIRKRSEFELGQRNPGGTVLSYKSNVPNSLDESDCNDDLTFGDDHRNNDSSRDNCRSDKLTHRENYSVVGGVRKIRQVETFLDKTVGLGPIAPPSVDGSSRNGDDFDSVLTLHDDKNRRLTGGVTGLKERLKTMRQSSSLNKEIKAARQLGVIMGAFTLCFLPYFILFLVVAFCDDCVKPAHLTAATWVGYLNSTLNPFLYPLCNANFRNRFKSMLG
ncbi:unnamed protein product, partial [Lymnaea stagnalis]